MLRNTGNSCNSIARKQITQFLKMGKEPEHLFSKKTDI